MLTDAAEKNRVLKTNRFKFSRRIFLFPVLETNI